MDWAIRGGFDAWRVDIIHDLCILKITSKLIRKRFSTTKMKVFKFGGASVKNAAGIGNVALIIQSTHQNNLLVVVSAMGKTTNALERVLNFHDQKEYRSDVASFKNIITTLCSDLFPDEITVMQKSTHLFRS